MLKEEEPAKEIEKLKNRITFDGNGKERAILIAEEGFLKIWEDTHTILQVEGQGQMLGWWVGELKEIQGGRSPRGWGSQCQQKVIRHRGISSPVAGREEGRNGDTQKSFRGKC